MAAYIIADIEVTDQDSFQEYRAKVPSVIASYGGRYLARGGETAALEGGWVPGRCVILEFPDLETARTFWDSPDYVPLRELRERSTRSRIIMVDGCRP